jgi:hypothetical protein
MAMVALCSVVRWRTRALRFSSLALPRTEDGRLSNSSLSTVEGRSCAGALLLLPSPLDFELGLEVVEAAEIFMESEIT